MSLVQKYKSNLKKNVIQIEDIYWLQIEDILQGEKKQVICYQTLNILIYFKLIQQYQPFQLNLKFYNKDSYEIIIWCPQDQIQWRGCNEEQLSIELSEILINKMNLDYFNYVNHLVQNFELPIGIKLYYYFTKLQLEVYSVQTKTFSDQSHVLQINKILRLYNQIEKAIQNSDFINFTAFSDDSLDHTYLALECLDSLILKTSIRKTQMLEFRKIFSNIYYKINQCQPHHFVFNQLQDDQVNQIYTYLNKCEGQNQQKNELKMLMQE